MSLADVKDRPYYAANSASGCRPGKRAHMVHMPWDQRAARILVKPLARTPVTPTTRVVQLPCYQLKTMYVYRIGAERLGHIGLAAIVIRPNGEIEVHPSVFKPERLPSWKP